MATCHNINRITLKDLTSNSKILKIIQESSKRSTYEALVSIVKKPALNRPVDNFINPLKLLARSNHNHETFAAVQTRADISVDDNVNVNAMINVVISCVKANHVHFSI